MISGETVRDEAYQSMAPECKRITHHEWGSVHPILTGIVSVALDEELIAFDPLAGMKFSSALFADKKVPDKKKETYSDEERDAFIRWCFEHFSETKDPAYLYAPLDFYTGGRIGELSALRWEDIISEEGRLFIHVCRMEQKNRITNEIKVVEKVKAHSERLIFLSNEAIRILDMLKSAATSVWIFARNGERINNRALAYINEKYAKEKGILNKSSHKSRKTYGSSMHRAGLTPAQCAAQLGNTPQVFLEHYLFPTEGKEEVFEMLNRIGKCKNEPESRIS